MFESNQRIKNSCLFHHDGEAATKVSEPCWDVLYFLSAWFIFCWGAGGAGRVNYFCQSCDMSVKLLAATTRRAIVHGRWLWKGWWREFDCVPFRALSASLRVFNGLRHAALQLKASDCARFSAVCSAWNRNSMKTRFGKCISVEDVRWQGCFVVPQEV